MKHINKPEEYMRTIKIFIIIKVYTEVIKENGTRFSYWDCSIWKIITLFFHHRNIKYILPEGREKK